MLDSLASQVQSGNFIHGKLHQNVLLSRTNRCFDTYLDGQEEELNLPWQVGDGHFEQ